MSQSNPAFTATVHIYHSKRDTYGNAYWAMTYVDHMTGARVYGRVSGGRSNITWAFPDAHHCDTQLGIREFKQTTKDWGHAGCTCTELQAYVQKGLQ
jgi:hypothetical protein